jgi:uncharacterized protein YndB with AHSA1/START domain
MSDTATASEITLTRIYDAPRQAVWDAWTRPEQIARWWGKRGWNTPPASVTMDVRPGGVFRLNSINDETGAELPLEAVYREVVEPERLSFAETSREDGAVGTVTFTDLGDGRTEMRFRTMIEASEEIRRSAAGGLASAFDRLAEHLG